MAVGFEFYNAQGELALSNLNRGFTYLGTATKISTVQPTYASEGYSQFQIDFSGNYLIPGISISDNSSVESSVSIVNITRSGNTWTITCCIGGGSTNSDGFLTESTGGTVRCWGNITTPSSLGLISYDSSGNLLNDILQNNLYISNAFQFNTDVLSLEFVGTFQNLAGPTFTRSYAPIVLATALGSATETIATQPNPNNNQTRIEDRFYRYRFYISKTVPGGGYVGPNATITLHRTPTLMSKYVELVEGTFGGSSFSANAPAQTVMFADGYRFAIA